MSAALIACSSPSAYVSMGAPLTRQVAVNVAALNGVAPPVPVLVRLAMSLVKLPVPSQAYAVEARRRR